VPTATPTLLPPEDVTPPQVTSVVANGGVQATEAATVTLALEVEDDRGVALLYVAERVYDSMAGQWRAEQVTGWVAYTDLYTLTLQPVGGARYLQVWVADAAGNISRGAAAGPINYLRPAGRLEQGQVHVYRGTLLPGEVLRAELATAAGDADLYVWDAAGNLWLSNNYDLLRDSVEVMAPAGEGASEYRYQIEVYGYRESTYTLQLRSIDGPSGGLTGERAGRSATAKVTPVAPVVTLRSVPPVQQVLPEAPRGGSVFLPQVQR
jgi:hypothetical protein